MLTYMDSNSIKNVVSSLRAKRSNLLVILEIASSSATGGLLAMTPKCVNPPGR